MFKPLFKPLFTEARNSVIDRAIHVTFNVHATFRRCNNLIISRLFTHREKLI